MNNFSADAVKQYPSLALVLDAMMRGRYYKDGVLRDGWRSVGFFMSVSEAMHVLKEVFGEEPMCKKCGQQGGGHKCRKKKKKRQEAK